MVEVFLILGLLFVLGLVIIVHIFSAVNLTTIYKLTGIPADPTTNPIFFSIEAILFLCILYIVKCLIS